MGWLSKLFGLEGAASPSLPLIVWREGSYPTQAVGESNYQAALEVICGGYSRHGHEVLCEASLIPDPTNPYDANAVKVVIARHLVGYLCRDDAIRFGEEMTAAGRLGEGARCAAKVKGGWRTNQYDEGQFGVSLGVPGRGAYKVE